MWFLRFLIIWRGTNSFGIRHLFLLQEKINAYLRFIESGEVYEHCPDGRSKNVIIRVVCAHKVDQRSMEMFERFQEAVQGAGFTLTTEYVAPQS
jgi:hypothetical protein